MIKVRKKYTFADWQRATVPPKGWDCADAIDDGWSHEDMEAFLRATVCNALPPFEVSASQGKSAPAGPAETARRTAAARSKVYGVEALSHLPRIYDVPHPSHAALASTLAGMLTEACGDVIWSEGDFWTWGPTCWSRLPAIALRRVMHLFDGASKGGGTKLLEVNVGLIDGVLTELKTLTAQPDFFADPVVGLNANNAVILIGPDGRIDTRAHAPGDGFRFTIDAEFHLHTDMDPPEGSMLHRLLAGSFKGDPDAELKVSLVGEILGAAAFGMATRLPQPKAFVFLGETANNGKSSIARLLSLLLPRGSVSSIPPAALEDQKRITALAGKAANVADELSGSSIAGETLKAAVTGNTIGGRDVYKSAVTFTPRALHLFTTNVLPRFAGGLDRGLQRRLVVLLFNRSIPAGEVIPDITDNIGRDEMDLLLGFAISGAQRLTRNRGYTIPHSSIEAMSAWLRLDPINEWAEERLVASTVEPAGGWSKTSDFYADFCRWAEEGGHQVRHLPNVSHFGRRLRNLPGLEFKRTPKGQRVVGVVIDTPGSHGKAW